MTNKPFTAVVLAPLSGHTPREDLRLQEFPLVRTDSVDDVIRHFSPTLNLCVTDHLSEDSAVELSLRFDCLADFTPAGVARQCVHVQQALRRRRELLGLNDPSQNVSGSDITSQHALLTEAVQLSRHISDQIDCILHDPEFQRLEASWRGVDLLRCALRGVGSNPVAVRLLNSDWNGLVDDLNQPGGSLFQSSLFRVLYSNGLGKRGKDPASAIIADFSLGEKSGRVLSADDVQTTRQLARVGSALFAPVVLGAGPTVFGIECFGDLARLKEPCIALAASAGDLWNRFRREADARYMCITAPSVLLRLPYRQWKGDQAAAMPSFHYQERVEGPNANSWLWGNAVFAVGAAMIRSHRRLGRASDIRGGSLPGVGGDLSWLVRPEYEPEVAAVSPRPSTRLVVTDELERRMYRLGLTPIASDRETLRPELRCARTLFDAQLAASGARTADRDGRNGLGELLPYVLNMSQIARELVIEGHDMAGLLIDDEGEIQGRLDRFLFERTQDSVSLFQKAKTQVTRVGFGTFHTSVELEPYATLEARTGALLEFGIDIECRVDGSRVLRGSIGQ